MSAAATRRKQSAPNPEKDDSVAAAREPQNVPQMFLQAMQRYAKTDALNHKRAGEWLSISGEQFVARVRAAAAGLRALGVKRGDRVALLAENSPEWSITDLAILSLGAVNVPVYTTQAPEQIKYILHDSGARTLFLSGKKILRQARQALLELPALERLIFFERDVPTNREETYGRATLSLQQLEADGAAHDKNEPAAYANEVDATQPDDLATILYTSGTTGEPKGVMLSHDNFVSNVLGIAGALPIYHTDTALSVLPLSHIFERTCFYVFCWAGVSVYYSASFDQVGEHLREVRPTVMTAVPRLFEKVYQKIVKTGDSAGGYKTKLFRWAMEVGREWAEQRDENKFVSPVLASKHALASRLVFSKWRMAIGGRLRYFVSGGAPLSPTLAHTFWGAGIPILQGYGMTETCVVSANRPDDNKTGSIGLPFPGIDVRLAEDGEIQLRGRNIMQGYYNQPEATRAAFTADGWFMTGDVGRQDAAGRLYITDRKKDLFKLSNGKYVAPQLVESLLTQSGLVGQAVVLGAGRKTVAALIVPNWENLTEALQETGERELPRDHAELARLPAAVKLMQREAANLTASLNEHERVKRIVLLPREFTIDGGELTPTLKVKRRVVDERYADVINELYGGKDER